MCLLIIKKKDRISSEKISEGIGKDKRKLDIQEDVNIKLSEVQKTINMEGIHKATKITLEHGVNFTNTHQKNKDWFKKWLTKNNKDG